MPELVIGHIFDKNPLHVKLSLPFVLRPDPSTSAIVHRGLHLSHATEMPTPIDTEEQVDRPLATHGPEGAVQALIAMFRAAPNGVLDGAVNVILRVALYDEHPPAFKIPVKFFRVVAVGSFQFLKDGVGFDTGGRMRLGICR